MSGLPIQIRPMTDKDVGFIVTSWLSSNRSSIQWLDRGTYFQEYRVAIFRTLKHAQVLVACKPDLQDLIYGWACAEPDRGLLHYVFVKEENRRLGIARRLVCEVVGDSSLPVKLKPTHWTRDGAELMQQLELLDELRPDLFNPKETKRANQRRAAGRDHDDAGQQSGDRSSDHEKPAN